MRPRALPTRWVTLDYPTRKKLLCWMRVRRRCKRRKTEQRRHLKNPILESNEGTATALSMYTESKAELKKMAEMRKKLSGGDAKGDGISHGNYASNALTKMGGGINGLMGFDSAQKETNTLLKKSNAILEKISSKAGSTTATWG